MGQRTVPIQVSVAGITRRLQKVTLAAHKSDVIREITRNKSLHAHRLSAQDSIIPPFFTAHLDKVKEIKSTSD